MIFLTGATGFLGSELLCRLLAAYPDQQLGLLIREGSGLTADERLRELARSAFGDQTAKLIGSRLRAIPGDAALDNFGMGYAQFAQLAAETDLIIHSAASTHLNPAIEDARRINVGGTANITRLAHKATEAAKLAGRANPRLFHISTAYVAGTRDGVVGADELRADHDFRNSYERSKAEAETLVRAQHDLDYCILRPSIIVGNSVTGYTSAFNVLYIPAKYIAKGLFRAVPASPTTPFDVVPVDYVADATVALTRLGKPLDRSYHLSVGVGRESTPLEILEQIVISFNNYLRKKAQTGKILITPPFLSPELVSRLLASISHAYSGMEKLVSNHLPVFKNILPLIPYMTHNPRFCAASTGRDLSGVLAHPPLFIDYAERLFEFCFETNWGKLPWKNQDEQARNNGAWFGGITSPILEF